MRKWSFPISHKGLKPSKRDGKAEKVKPQADRERVPPPKGKRRG